MSYGSKKRPADLYQFGDSGKNCKKNGRRRRRIQDTVAIKKNIKENE